MRITLTKAKAHLHDLVRRAERGETIVITYRGREAVRLVPDETKTALTKRARSRR